MPRFVFSLDRVLRYRQTQLRLEQSRLEELEAELRALEEGRRKLQSDALQAHERIASAGRGSGAAELLPVDAYQGFLRSENLRLQLIASQMAERIAGQREKVRQASQSAKLLERLREKREAEWQAAAAKALDDLAADAYLARWKR